MKLHHALSRYALLFALSSITATADEPALYPTLTLSYDSEYYIHGYNLGRNLFHADLSIFRPLSEQSSGWAGLWYGYLPDGTYHEVDVYAGWEHAIAGPLRVGLSYSLFYYIEVPFEADTVAHELAAYTSIHLDPVALSLWARYDTDAEGTLLQFNASAEHPVRDGLTLRAEATVTYALQYYIEQNLWNHAQFWIKLPYALTERSRIIPFVSHTIPFAAIDAFESKTTFGGVSYSLDL
jgi:hypothetical protein